MYIYVSVSVSVYVYVYMCICVYVYMCICVYVCVCMYGWMDGWMHACMYGCMYACMHVCMYACMHVCMYACMHVCMSACMHVCMCACVHVCMCACVHVCMCACVHVCMCACVHVCMCACVHVCMCACVHACMYVCMDVCMHACMHACMYVCIYIYIVCIISFFNILYSLFIIVFFHPNPAAYPTCFQQKRPHFWAPAESWRWRPPWATDRSHPSAVGPCSAPAPCAPLPPRKPWKTATELQYCKSGRTWVPTGFLQSVWPKKTLSVHKHMTTYVNLPSIFLPNMSIYIYIYTYIHSVHAYNNHCLTQQITIHADCCVYRPRLGMDPLFVGCPNGPNLYNKNLRFPGPKQKKWSMSRPSHA